MFHQLPALGQQTLLFRAQSPAHSIPCLLWPDHADTYKHPLDVFRRHPGLRDQLERAAFSISNNIAEGFERGSTRELIAFLYISRGSAGEVRSMLRVLEKWTVFSDHKSQITNLTVKCEKIQLYGWIDQLKNTDIRGQRHFDDEKRIAYAKRNERNAFIEELRRIAAKPDKT